MAEESIQETQEQQEPHGEEQREEIDWKAEARKWERRAKENKEAADRLANEQSGTASRISELEERASKAEQEADSLRHRQQLADWAEQAAKETGVPAAILRGETLEEFQQHAAAIKASYVAPVVRDSGETHNPPKSNRAIFDKFMSDNF